MKYWLCVTNEENWEVVKARKVWGVSERNRRQIEEVKAGDMLVFYVKPKKIMGILKATTDSFRSDEKIFSAAGFAREELFPYRVKLELFAVCETPLNFEELVAKLKFIANKKKWPGYLRRAMRAISKDDFELIKDGIGGRL